MDGADFLPNDLAECQRLLLAAFRRRSARTSRDGVRAAGAEQNRVLQERRFVSRATTRARCALDELAWYKRWAYGRRRERLVEDQGQGHLFELDLATNPDLPKVASSDNDIEVQSHLRRRKNREIDWISCRRSP